MRDVKDRSLKYLSIIPTIPDLPRHEDTPRKLLMKSVHGGQIPPYLKF